MKIYIANTGGTMGMMPSDHGLVANPVFAEQLTRQLESSSELDHEFVVHSYDTPMVAANVTPKDWQTIARDIESKWQEFDAFIVLHGTDTMAYTAAALCYMIAPSKKPIIVTGSRAPMGKARSDAMNNVLGAVSACEANLKGVFLFFANRLIDGDRAHLSHTSDWQAFSSPKALEYGVLESDWKWRDSSFAQLLIKPPMKIRIPDMDEGAVTVLPVFPGVQVQHWQGLLTPQVKGAVLLSYGAGTVPTTDPELYELLKSATDQGVVIVNVSQCEGGRIANNEACESEALARAGVISGKDSTHEAAFARLHFLIGLGLDSREIKGVFNR
ncbi:asparaginase domain-containing protein [Marinomonas pollencensis]|uniref:L-asparaginase n=1 Tax=Marinomonas pollencensis TaxID=491954 RepID=A0A3E0DJV4_9GAMM|nr:asparaginase domain-containing protein [Marinomonas pollencensis]REG82347.1 L-asparaginase [Marinomonas pollencensis]